MLHNNLTIVTSLFDLGRDKIDAGFSRSFEHYLECFSKLLQVDLPMIIFCDTDVEAFVWKHRKSENTRIVRKTLADLRAFPFYDQIQAIRTSPAWVERSGWIPGSPQASMELYNALVMSKQFFLNDASIFNYFDTKFFMWADAGLSNTLNLVDYLTPEMCTKLTNRMHKMMYVAFPYDGTVEVHGFEKRALDRYAGTTTEYVVRGGLFGGTRSAICDMNDIYYGLLNDTLNSGLMGTEESIFTIMSYRNADKISLNMIESNGLIYKFLENLATEPVDFPENDGSVAIYALTYNLPKQFKLWVDSFRSAYPKEFHTFNKYVINNSTDPSVDAEYQRLFKENGFIEFKYDNIGINDGRYEAAVHFNKSTHEYMIFFEDDMLLHNNSNNKSGLGFNTYYESIFDKVCDIVKYEDLDFLKLTFDEFYGNNTENWGWYNVPEKLKKEYFPDGDKRTKVSYIGSFKGVPYAVGEYHYCNWPIVFTKRGNKKVFLDTVYEHKYEQTWMSMVCTMQKERNIKCGVLLASIINHNRAYHYSKEIRKENKSS